MTPRSIITTSLMHESIDIDCMAVAERIIALLRQNGLVIVPGRLTEGMARGLNAVLPYTASMEEMAQFWVALVDAANKELS